MPLKLNLETSILRTNMFEGKLSKSLTILALLSLAQADEASDLRDSIDSKLLEKDSIRNDREQLLNQLHVFSDNREIKKTNLDTKEKNLLYTYRDYFAKESECDSLDYQRSLLDGVENVSELGECLQAPLADSAKSSQKAYFQNDFLGPISDIVQRFYDQQSAFLTQWSRQATHYQNLSQIYYPSGPYQKANECLQNNSGNEGVCDDLQAYAERVEEIYGQYRGTMQSIGRTSKFPVFNLGYVRQKKQEIEGIVQSNIEVLQTEGPALKQSEQSCWDSVADELQLLNQRITERNLVKDNLNSQEQQVDEYLGYANQKVDDLETKTSDAQGLVDQLSDVELN